MFRLSSKLPGAALHLMKLQGTVDALPQIMVTDGHQFAKPFPLPIRRAPFIHAVLEAPVDVTAFRDERHPSRAIDCLKPSYHS
jgi:hypothetical protein